MFITFISMLNNSMYLSVVLQLKDGGLTACLPCLCLYASSKLAVIAPHVALVSASLVVMITAVAAQIATCEATLWIASVSTILA